MLRSMLAAKLHGIRVTGSDLHYEGSIVLDPVHCERVGLLPFQFVEIWNKCSGARISTYVIYGRRRSGCCVLNGAAARTCQVGDELIIAAQCAVSDAELATLRPRVLIFDHRNRAVRLDQYRMVALRNGRFAARRVIGVKR